MAAALVSAALGLSATSSLAQGRGGGAGSGGAGSSSGMSGSAGTGNTSTGIGPSPGAFSTNTVGETNKASPSNPATTQPGGANALPVPNATDDLGSFSPLPSGNWRSANDQGQPLTLVSTCDRSRVDKAHCCRRRSPRSSTRPPPVAVSDWANRKQLQSEQTRVATIGQRDVLGWRPF